MDSNAYNFYTKRFEVQDSLKKEPQSTNVNHAQAEQRSQPDVDKEQSKTLTQLENVKLNDKENYPNRFLVVKGGESVGVDDSDQSVDGRASRLGEVKSTQKRPLQCLESLAKCAGESAAEYEAASVLLTLDKHNNSTVVRSKAKGAEVKSDADSGQQDKADHKVKLLENGQQPFKGQEQSVSSQSKKPNVNYLSLQGQPLFQNQPLLQVVNKLEQRNPRVNFIVSTMSNEIKPQQMVVENGPQTQMNIHHEQQHHQTVAVVSSIPNSMPTHPVAQPASVTAMQQQNTTALAPMQSLQTIQSNAQQQIGADWGPGRVQVIQQPLQNNSYLQQLYNTQGPLLMPGNIALHPGINSQQIQVITAGKAFQGNQLTPHMLTQGKQVLQGQTGPFPGYAIPTSQNQTFVFSPLNVINSQPSILPAHSQAAVSTITQPQKPADIQKAINNGKVSAAKNPPAAAVQTQCVQVSQPVLQTTPQPQIISPLQASGQTMQFAPWQISGALPQVWAGGLQAGALSAGGLLAPNPIFLRAPQPEAPPMFIQHSPQNNVQSTTANLTCQSTPKPRPTTETTTRTQRPLSTILPSTGIRPASSVSTQTGNNRQMIKYRNKLDNVLRASPAPATKQDAANQTSKVQPTPAQNKQQAVVHSNIQISTAQEKHQVNKSVQSQPIILQQQPVQQLPQSQIQLQQQSSQQQIAQHYPQAITTMQHAAVNQTIPMAAMPQTISMVPQLHSLTGMTAGTALVQPTAAAPIAQLHTMPPQAQSLMQGSLVQTSAGMTVQNPSAFSHATPLQTTGLQALDGTTLMAASPLVQLLSQEMRSNTMASSQLTLQGASMGLVAQPIQATVMNALPISQPQPIVAQIKPNEDKVESTIVSSVVPVQTTTPQVVAADTPSTSTVMSSATSLVVSTVTLSVASSVTSSTTSVPESKVTTSVTYTVTAPVATVSTTTESTKVPPKTVSPTIIKNESERGQPSPVTSTASRPSTPSSSVTTASIATSGSTSTPIVTRAPVSSATSTSPSVKTLATTTNRSNGLSHLTPDKSLPKAMIKPILTHVIEGYVIQEAAEPFAVNRPCRDWPIDKSTHESSSQSNEQPPRKKALLDLAAASSSPSEELDTSTTTEPLTPSSVKSESASTPSTSSMDEDEEMVDTATNDRPNVRQWNMMDVHEFIRNIPGAADYADDFLAQEVDGLALLLIRPEHLVMALSMKLGPALKIFASINAIRPDSEDEDNSD